MVTFEELFSKLDEFPCPEIFQKHLEGFGRYMEYFIPVCIVKGMKLDAML